MIRCAELMAHCTGRPTHDRYSWAAYDAGCDCVCDDVKFVPADSWLNELVEREVSLLNIENDILGDGEQSRPRLLAVCGLRVSYPQPKISRAVPQLGDTSPALGDQDACRHMCIPSARLSQRPLAVVERPGRVVSYVSSGATVAAGASVYMAEHMQRRVALRDRAGRLLACIDLLSCRCCLDGTVWIAVDRQMDCRHKLTCSIEPAS